MVIIVVLLAFLNILVWNNGSVSTFKNRTIMIYMSGSNLESEGAIATADIKSIISDDIDLKNTNVLIYTGGTKKWHNFVSADENAIYSLEDDGFEKKKSFKLSNLGDENTFISFLNFVTSNYQASKYDLVFWNHGLGAMGSVMDDYTEDYLSIVEMGKALQKSSFGGDNKFETVIFRTCLNSTAEVASIFAPYANVMVASEEVTVGSNKTNVLNFINNIEKNDDAAMVGERFVESYQRQMKRIDPYATFLSTYSILDLTKFDELESDLNDFFGSIDLKKNYANIAKIRGNLYQFGVSSSNCYDFDTVDLYQLIDSLKRYSSSDKAKEIFDDISQIVVKNWSTKDDYKGLAIYFPFNAEYDIIDMHMNLYSKLDFCKNYYNFIKDFDTILSSPADFNYDYDLSENYLGIDEGKEFSLQLTPEQVESYASSSYIVFRKEDDGLFTPIYKSSETILDENGVLRTTIDGKLLKLVDSETGDEFYLQAILNDKNNEQLVYTTYGIMYNTEENEYFSWSTKGVKIFVRVDANNKPVITQMFDISSDNINGTVYELEDFTTISLTNLRYKILDDEGNYNQDWVSSGTSYYIETKTDVVNDELRFSSLDDGDYYCVFGITDIKNNKIYSNLVKID